MERIEVSDLFKAYYEVMSLIWKEPDFRNIKRDEKPYFVPEYDDIIEYLEEHLFLAGCARRVFKRTGLNLSIVQIYKRLEVCDLKGCKIPGDFPELNYWGSGFDFGEPGDEKIPPLVVKDLTHIFNLEEVRLFINLTE